SISGKPVRSLTSRTASPASSRALRVPPVESSSTLNSARVRASSSRPVLSLTLSRARRIGRGLMTHNLLRGRRGWYTEAGRAVQGDGRPDGGRLLAAGQVPQLDRVIVARRGQGLAVRAERHGLDAARVSLEGGPFLPAPGVPQLDRVIVARR